MEISGLRTLDLFSAWCVIYVRTDMQSERFDHLNAEKTGKVT